MQKMPGEHKSYTLKQTLGFESIEDVLFAAPRVRILIVENQGDEG